jgi:hypothetical protein
LKRSGANIALLWSAEIGELLNYKHLAPLERNTSAAMANEKSELANGKFLLSS